MNSLSVILSYVVTVLPMFFGLVKWKSLPDKIAIHFALDGTPNGYAPKLIAVVLTPIILLVIQIVCVTTMKTTNTDTSSTISIIKTWIVPVVSMIVAVAIYRFALK